MTSLHFNAMPDSRPSSGHIRLARLIASEILLTTHGELFQFSSRASRTAAIKQAPK
jgi:hypothetical protein